MTGSENSAGTVLVVDDVEDLRRLVTMALRRSGFAVLEAASGEAAMAILDTEAVDVVVLDMGLPEMSGTDVVRALRARPETATLPVLLMTGSGTSQSVIDGLDAGADDFLAKPVRLDELVARVRAHLRRHVAWSKRVADEILVRASVVSALGHMTLSAEPEAAAEAVVGELARRTDSLFIGVAQLLPGDRLQSLATFNRLPPVGTYNRRQGVSVGGPLPAERANYLVTKARQGPWVERVLSAEQGEPNSPFWSAGLALIAGAPIYVGATLVGVLTIGTGSVDAIPSIGEQSKLMAAAIDYASILTAVVGPALVDRRQTGDVRTKLRRDLAAGSFHPVFQPIVALETREVVGFEALTRFDDGTRPDVRFAEATALGVGDAYELAAIEAALTEGSRLPVDAFLTVNVSPAVLLSGSKRLKRLVAGTTRPVVLELTEHVPISDYSPLRQAIAGLGPVEIAVDDAGAGYASLRHILELRPAFAKLDISLVRGIDGDELRQAMAAGFQYYALRTGCRLIAEGVETEDEASALKMLGVDLAQGYLFGRPEELPT